MIKHIIIKTISISDMSYGFEVYCVEKNDFFYNNLLHILLYNI